MKQQINNCNPTICNQTDLMSDTVFMNKTLIKEYCTKCIKQEVCIRIVELLKAHKPQDALDLLLMLDEEKTRNG